MNTCLKCGQPVGIDVTLKMLLDFSPLQKPVLCAACRDRFTVIDPKFACPFCGRMMENRVVCGDCECWGDGDQFQNRALYVYDEALKEYFSDYKFRGDYRLRLMFSRELEIAVKAAKCDLVTVVPVTAETMANRGFNQVAGMLGGCPVTQTLATIETKKITRQSERDRKARMLSVQPFKRLPDLGQRLVGQRVLVVDDVYTTGRTIRHAANLLRQAGAKKVVGLTLAHG